MIPRTSGGGVTRSNTKHAARCRGRAARPCAPVVCAREPAGDPASSRSGYWIRYTAERRALDTASTSGTPSRYYRHRTRLHATPPTGPATAAAPASTSRPHCALLDQYHSYLLHSCTSNYHPPSTRSTYSLWILGRATSHLSNGSEMEPSLLTGGTAPLSEAEFGTDPANRAWKGAPSGCTMRSAPAGRTRAHLARRRIAPLHSCARAPSMCQ